MKKILLFSALFFSTLISFSQDVDFVNSEYLPGPRAATSSANDGENIYLVNGFSDTDAYTNEIYKRESNGTWSVLSDLTISKRYETG